MFGTVVRSLSFPAAIWLGTVLLSAGIAFGNVLLPGLVKRDFPQRAGSGPGERCKRFIAVARGKLALILPS